jgi:hypothetical protein
MFSLTHTDMAVAPKSSNAYKNRNITFPVSYSVHNREHSKAGGAQILAARSPMQPKFGPWFLIFVDTQSTKLASCHPSSS